MNTMISFLDFDSFLLGVILLANLLPSRVLFQPLFKDRRHDVIMDPLVASCDLAVNVTEKHTLVNDDDSAFLEN